MFRTLILSTTLLVAAVTASADDAAPPGAREQSEPAPKQLAANADNAKREKPKTDGEAKSQEDKPQGDVEMSGMSILGNDEAPKSLVIVPWKSSQLGDAPGLSKLLDDSTQPVDKDVFLRELAYYQIRTNSK
jgi:hypothetical protein